VDLLYGVHPVAECLRAGRRGIRKLWVTDSGRLRELTEASGRSPALRPETVNREACQRLCGSANHQGIVAQVEDYPYMDWRDLLEGEQPLVLVLDNLTDPQNVGAILRSALCAGATGVTLRKHHAALITPAVAKASAGACEHLQVALVPNQSLFLREAEKAGFNRAALSMEGESIWESHLDWREPLALVVGAEGRGISQLVGSLCEYHLTIPIRSGFDSLNASVAASLALFEAARHRR
jgi:23S rRNA (guanosine2251-2'-O)-methyltransferase